MKRFLIILFLLGAIDALGQPSVLSTGNWYKLSVEEDGIYKIDYDLLKKSGINPDLINPNNIQIYGGVNGMLPQPISTPRINDLKELAIHLAGASDNKFNREDYILFYGQGPDAYQLQAGKGIFQYQNNLYSDKNFYFITIGETAGKRIAEVPSLAGVFPIVDEYDHFGYYELEKVNELHSGRDWFGEIFDSKTENTIRFEIPGILDGTSIKLVSNVMGQSFAESSFQLFFNDVLIGEQRMDPIVNSQYAIKGIERTDTLTFSATIVGAPSKTNQDIKLKFNKAASGRSVGYLDYLLVQSKRRLALYGDQTIFHSLKSLTQPSTTFSITSMPTDGFVWDITDSFEGKIQQINIQTGVGRFSASSTVIKKYIVSSNKNYPTPKTEGEVTNQNLHGLPPLDLLIVTAPEFLAEAQRLASLRQSNNSLRVSIATTTEIYNEFSGGKQDVTAIRDAAQYLYFNGNGIKSLLLFGRGSYDYKNYFTYNKNFVPIYESRNSLSPLETYSSDDYFGFLENNEGNWGENPPENHTLDIGVGRLPVKSIEEAATIVDKLIQYENKNWGEWRKEILFVADDGDFNIHQGQADQLAEDLEFDHPEFNTKKIYIDAFKQIKSNTSGQASPQAVSELNNNVRKGVTIVNYTGHGGEQQWMQERIFDQITLDKWTTAPHYPLLITATCEFGRNDDPGLISTAELSLFRKKAGAIGMLTTARPVNSSTNFTLNNAFYQSLFIKDQNQFRNIGAILRDTKNTSLSGVANRNFSLLGDPSMKIALPSAEVKISEVKNLTSGSDTLKALSKVRVKGSIFINGVQDAGYNGILNATFFDKPTNEETKGDENLPFTFKSRENAAFRGAATIRNGLFEFEFITPSSVDPAVAVGKLGVYAFSNSNASDVTGVVSNVKIGGLEKNPGSDTKGPSIELFVGDSTFVDGGIAGTNSRIVAILSDENGINTSTFIAEKAIIATLDDSLSFVISKYYQSDIDNYKHGKVIFPIDDLKPGEHHLSLKASDTYGNTSTTSITFSVSDESGIRIEQLLNYPNPVFESTTFHFKHNRSGEDIEAGITIFDRLGQTVLSSTYQITNSSYQVDLPVWEATNSSGIKLGAGLYLLKLSLRSLLDGSKNEKITKVIIAN
ncbi:MAG: type IX secretion system sortase PorU [Cyclobacteriaceae bacterium]|nr:type IX secretion system sortase PorU [Cyclobacteriaceae bacterium]